MLGYVVVKKEYFNDLKDQLKKKSDFEKDAPKKIKDLENVIERKNGKITDLTKSNQEKDLTIQEKEKYAKIIEKNNDELLKSIAHGRAREESLEEENKKLQEDNSKLSSENRSMFAKIGGLTKANKDYENKINNYKQMLMSDHVSIKPSEYDLKIKTVAQKKKEARSN